jgi:hypothetical protein
MCQVFEASNKRHKPLDKLKTPPNLAELSPNLAKLPTVETSR